MFDRITCGKCVVGKIRCMRESRMHWGRTGEVRSIRGFYDRSGVQLAHIVSAQSIHIAPLKIQLDLESARRHCRYSPTPIAGEDYEYVAIELFCLLLYDPRDSYSMPIHLSSNNALFMDVATGWLCAMSRSRVSGTNCTEHRIER